VPRLRIANTKELKQSPDAVLVAVGALAAKASYRVQFVGLKIGRAGVQFVAMLLHPRTCHIVLARAQWRLIESPRFKRHNNRVLLRLRNQNIVGVIVNSSGGIS
jgi:hypothetical protein